MLLTLFGVLNNLSLTATVPAWPTLGHRDQSEKSQDTGIMALSSIVIHRQP